MIYINGVIVVNKPEGYTSRDVVNKLVCIFHTKKIGHTGTLDPLATGVLVVAIGSYTKLVNYITSYDKEYIAEIKLGVKTDTSDITGTVLEENYNYSIDTEKVLNVFKEFPKTKEARIISNADKAIYLKEIICSKRYKKKREQKYLAQISTLF